MRHRDIGRALRGPLARTALALLVGVFAPIAAAIVTVDLAPVEAARITALPMVAAIVVASWLGGMGPGLVATGMALGVSVAGIMPAAARLDGATDGGRVELALLAGTGVLIAALAGLRTRAEGKTATSRRRVEEALDHADAAARRVDALQGLATDLNDSETTDEMLAALLRRGSAALRADRAVVAASGGDAGDVRVIASLSPGSGSSAAALDADAAATLSAVVQTGRASFDPTGPAGAGASAVVSLPMPRGPAALAFYWDHPEPMGPDRRMFIAALARAGSAALDRHRMFAAELSALHRAEAATGFIRILADAGRALGATLDHEDLVRRLPSIAIPRLGEVGIFDLYDGPVPRRLVATSPGLLDGAAAELGSRSPAAAEQPGAAQLQVGRAANVRLDAAAAAGLGGSAAGAAALGQLAPAWLLQLPIAVGGALYGVLSLVRQTDQPFEQAEVDVGEELGWRAGRALENARLHRQVEALAELDRRRASELGTVLGAVGEAFLLVDGDGRVRASNRAATRLLGRPVGTLEELCAQFLDPTGRVLRSLPDSPQEVQVRDRPGDWVEITVYRVEPSTARGRSTLVVACRDVSAFRRGQALREAFLGLLSHELRTPVTAIYGGAAMLSRRGRRLAPEVAEEVVADIAAEANRLYQLVEDLMVLARFDEGLDLGLQPILLQHVVPAIIASESGRWPSVAFGCEVAPDTPTAAGDETAVTQVVRNLLSNAAKYSPAGGAVQVSVRPAEEGIRVAVRDHGPGFNPAESQRLFDPFFRSESTAGLASGAGIGLYVTRRLVDAMGGRVSLSLADGGGSEFAFTLPRHPDEPG